LHSPELPIVCGSRLFFDLCTTSRRPSKEDQAHFALEISAEIDRQQTLLDPKVFCAAFATLGVNLGFVREPLTFCQTRKPGLLNGADVNKHIVSAIIGLDEAKTLPNIEPLHSTYRHPLLQSARAHAAWPSRDQASTSSMSLEKEPAHIQADTFNKAQRLVEPTRHMHLLDKAQGQGTSAQFVDAKPAQR
jgi:hypothetical protein